MTRRFLNSRSTCAASTELFVIAIVVILNSNVSLATPRISLTTANGQAAGSGGGLSSEQARLRLEHSQELLGKYYGRSTVRFGESVPKINSDIYRWTRERLPQKFKRDSGKIAQTIIDESLKRGFDPVFLISIIETESSFNPQVLGGAGEIGLMQILPSTAEWISAKAGLTYKGHKTLKDPVANIRIGAAYLAFLRDRFDMHARLYIAAYNMGQGNVDSAQAKNIWPKDYPGAVMRNYVSFYERLRDKRPPGSRHISMAN
jgi:soluble lytic murein transglycosylase